MKMPKTFKLNNYTWSVHEVDQSIIDVSMKDQGPTGSYRGYCDTKEFEVVVSDRLHKQDKPRVILHEILHACFRNSDVPSTASDEEKVVCCLEERLTDLIKNNPKLISYLQENL